MHPQGSKGYKEIDREIKEGRMQPNEENYIHALPYTATVFTSDHLPPLFQGGCGPGSVGYHGVVRLGEERLRLRPLLGRLHPRGLHQRLQGRLPALQGRQWEALKSIKLTSGQVVLNSTGYT